jgi:hypothetical protein
LTKKVIDEKILAEEATEQVENDGMRELEHFQGKKRRAGSMLSSLWEFGKLAGAFGIIILFRQISYAFYDNTKLFGRRR